MRCTDKALADYHSADNRRLIKKILETEAILMFVYIW